jgi:MYXO-CTERM domain-containing protein
MIARWSFLAVAVATFALAPATADAFCGFYVSGADSGMFNNATQVVLMREGTRTVLSMQNNYQGPPTDFAMVVPVPVVLEKENVKTLPRDVFTKVDAMGAPRLVEYWEVDPCMAEMPYDMGGCPMCGAGGAPMVLESATADADYGVKVEARFEVGEYQVVILSATEATGLERWLRDQRYRIPRGAEPLLRPYVEAGSKFFVAKVDPKKVTFEKGMATLSPLRFHYDSEEFSLPVRLGLANSAGTQDLIVNILSSQRYEVANYKNVTIPTNLDVKEEARARFGEFYAALFDRTIEQNPGAVVTEYAWDAATCDPCPGPTLDYHDFATLGADVLEGGSGAYVLTRLHARYAKDDLTDDLVFKGVQPIVGGREQMGADGKLEERARPDSYNNFQGRYAIRHEWTGVIACESPIRGRWGGPPAGVEIAGGAGATQAATNTAFAPRGAIELPMVVAEDVPEIGVKAGVPLPKSPGAVSKGARGCACSSDRGAEGAAGALALSAVVGMLVIRRRRRN